MKHRFLAKKYWKDASTPFGTTNEKAAQFDDCINLSIGDPDLITDKIIIDGAYQDALKGHTRYTNMYGDIELRDEIRKFYKDEYDLDIAPDEVIVTTSGLIAMYGPAGHPGRRGRGHNPVAVLHPIYGSGGNGKGNPR